jgi:hypothetical protein
MTLANMRQNGVRTLGVTLDPAWEAMAAFKAAWEA